MTITAADKDVNALTKRRMHVKLRPFNDYGALLRGRHLVCNINIPRVLL
jgi:hypothetical protein